MADINGIPYAEPTDLVSGYPAVSLALATELDTQLASKLPYSFGTATPSTTTSGFLWYDSNSTPAAPKFWDGSAFQALTSGKILQIVRATDATDRTTTSTTYVDANISVTITPQKSDSAIILIWSLQVSQATTTSTRQFRITDASNNAISGAEDVRLSLESTYIGTMVLIGYATPATTSAETYKGRFLVQEGSQTIRNATQTGQLYAIEVSA